MTLLCRQKRKRNKQRLLAPLLYSLTIPTFFPFRAKRGCVQGKVMNYSGQGSTAGLLERVGTERVGRAGCRRHFVTAASPSGGIFLPLSPPLPRRLISRPSPSSLLSFGCSGAGLFVVAAG